ncbi:MAG: response regulator transcription factor [Endomicrobium sp.]|jgi:two-component system alkaline phosphatase synthesis response regulator PhoP|nr:response regulator transcription factor [Endomicrobium sp.]
MIESKIIVVDDEDDLRSLAKGLLEEGGYMVVTCKDTDEGYQRMLKSKPDLAIVDINMPTIGGIEFCRLIRQTPTLKNTPIIMLTVESTETNKVIGFDSGADDYIVKPFSNRELVARVKALIRRSKRKDTVNKLESDGLVISLEGRTVSLNGKKIQLRPKEFDLLFLLLQKPGIVLNREFILENVFEYNISITTRTIDTHIKNLRNALKPWGRKHIKTIFGIGFKFEPNKK